MAVLPGMLEETVEGLALIDHHCHGVVLRDLDREAFEDLITEGFHPAPPGTSHFDSPLGLAIRRWCAPVLDLEPLAPPEDYLARRRELGAGEASRRFLRAAGLGALLVDTGYRAGELLDPAGMGTLAEVPAHEVVRLEAVAEGVAGAGVSAQGYPEAFRGALEEAARGAVGLKTIAAYRGGLALDPELPSRKEVVRSAGRWLREGGRLRDPVLLRFGIWTGAGMARERGLPLQIHTGFGDPDLTLHLANPSLLTDLLKRLGDLGVDVALLHCYPYHREAAAMAAVLPNVYFDIGLALTYTGPSSRRVIAEALELAPFTKQLYSSDGFGLAELHYLGALLFRRGLARVLEGWMARGDCSEADAARIAELIGRENAERIYPIGHSEGTDYRRRPG